MRWILAFTLLTAGCGELREVPLYGATDRGAPVVLSNADGRNAYAGVVRLSGGNTCTAVLLDTGAGAGAPAYLLTNGHCVGAFAANEVLRDEEHPEWSATFGFFEDTAAAQDAVAVRRVGLGTLKGADIGIVELDATLGTLERRGYRPWKAADAPPSGSEPVVVVGAPLQEIGTPDFLRLASCAVDGVAPVVLERQWYWHDLARLRCEGIQAGSSGSPVISRVSGRVLGLVNTTTRLSGRLGDCALDRPCEPDGLGAASRTDTSYGVPLIGIGLCFDEDGALDLERPACPLDTGRGPRPSPDWLGAVNPALAQPVFGAPQTRWDVTVTGTGDSYRYKTGPAASVDCRSDDGYGTARPLAQPIDDALPRAEGYYALCLIGGDEAPRHPAIATVRIDTTAPSHPPRFDVEGGSKDGYRIVWRFDDEVVGAFFKYGPAGATSCADPRGYRGAFIPFFSLEGKPPFRFCAYGYDAALNPSPTSDTLLP